MRVALADAGILLEQLDRLEQQIVEVERAGVAERLDVTRIQPADLAIARIPRVLERSRPLHPVLGVADAAQDRRAADRFVVEVMLLISCLITAC